ncbi:iron chelate uptake ABC transporter family permease subunit [Shimia sp. CNT1-13L.2]|uniref:ABC transporter permease n=1 Tax=Shimia sp. CNT1-13L.2 TaxID=2959663 RepID=UPI0020CF84CF|nr:iron chelate uptake ABC transporter family permease subunit [Shimia sp. CNT1-13L.2]MCP9484097.1 iron chelate uptake ABC transporter family permease subunit [Shimia sp. CNT1-13L.2]
MALLLTLLCGVSLFVGTADLPWAGNWLDREALKILLISRLPRTAAAVLTGSSMAVAGIIMQLLVRNRFVEPGTTGTTEAAMLGLLLVTLLAPSTPIFLKMVIAAISALIGMGGFLLLARRLPPSQPLLVPLVGLIYGGIIGAGVIFIAYQADMLQYLAVWMSGEFSGVLAGRYELLWLAGAMAVLAYFAADQFTIAGLGKSAGVSLGLNYGQVMALGLLTVSMVTALVVVTIGMVPFVGLVVPNIVSRFMGDNLRANLPIVAGLGGILVLASDIIGRVVRFPYEIPAGTIFGVFGATIFLWLLLSRPARAS